MILLLVVIFLLIPLLLLTLSLIIINHHSNHREKGTPFECGFDPHSNARVPFSLRFFLLGILFIVFDVEIALIMPLPALSQSTPGNNFIIVTTIFLVLLIAGMLHEWNEGALNWVF